MNGLYYREKVLKLVERLFIETGDAKSRILNCEEKILCAKLASGAEDVPHEIRKRWIEIWDELNKEPELNTSDGKIILSSFKNTVSKKRNKSMEKYLLFFLEEFYRVLVRQ